MSNRRSFLARLASAGAGLLGRRAVPIAGGAAAAGAALLATSAAAQTKAANIPVEMPDLPKLPFKLVDGVKEFHLIAEVVRTTFVPGRTVDAWGFNGSVPGPTIEVNQGDRVRVVFENRLPEMSAIHWHGFEVPHTMDGSVGLGQDPVPPGGKFVYEFTLNQHGTFFYHSHFAMQEMMGMLGMFVMHPKEPNTPAVDRDFGIIMQEWAILPNNTVPNTLSMEFNWLTFNGKAGPACTPMLVKVGERVRIRLINIGMDHHPIHLHGNQFEVTGTEAGRIPPSGWFQQNTVLVGVGQARDIEFHAKYAGEWMLHCHLPHHMMNQMVSMVGPMTQGGHGLHSGGSMTEGMGMMRQGSALSDSAGPALGRGLGLAADQERATSHLGHTSGAGEKLVPGFPQDMWMPMDHLAGDKPELHGLRKDWSGGMMGMMTLIRVLTPEKYDEIMGLKQRPPQAAGAKPRVSHEFRGRVTAAGEGRLTVRHGNIEGWMAAMTMAYEVDKPEVLTRIKAGDEIRATVYDGDPMLYNVEVVRQ